MQLKCFLQTRLAPYFLITETPWLLKFIGLSLRSNSLLSGAVVDINFKRRMRVTEFRVHKAADTEVFLTCPECEKNWYTQRTCVAVGTSRLTRVYVKRGNTSHLLLYGLYFIISVRLLPLNFEM